jgi:hypothetical protein
LIVGAGFVVFAMGLLLQDGSIEIKCKRIDIGNGRVEHTTLPFRVLATSGRSTADLFTAQLDAY